MFSINPPKQLRLVKLNLRDEHHGDQLKKAVDMIVSGQWANTVLDQFHAALRAALYSKAGPDAGDDVQRDLDLAVTDMPNIRFARLETPLKWDQKMEGATVEVHYGAGKPIVLTLCKVDDFRFTPLEGGTVEIAFKVSTSADITEKVLGKLGIICGDIEISLAPPTVEGTTPQAPLGNGDNPEAALSRAVH